MANNNNRNSNNNNNNNALNLKKYMIKNDIQYFCVYMYVYIRHIRPYLTTEASKTFMDAMIFSNISYCFTNWSQANVTTLKPIETLYKQNVKNIRSKTYQLSPLQYYY